MNPHPHTSLATFVVYILVAIIFAVGGYFIGKGNTTDQAASIYNNRLTSVELLNKPWTGPGEPPTIFQLGKNGLCWEWGWYQTGETADTGWWQRTSAPMSFCLAIKASPDGTVPVSKTGTYVPTKTR